MKSYASQTRPHLKRFFWRTELTIQSLSFLEHSGVTSTPEESARHYLGAQITESWINESGQREVPQNIFLYGVVSQKYFLYALLRRTPPERRDLSARKRLADDEWSKTSSMFYLNRRFKLSTRDGPS
eukprot:Plantae.Rhodophyta-Hildenbrandia_rubra.ctg13570.p1 GENE.Plantae.Rhodophyta-Hildenbrandia_rubra.ctg13570~~Plantae.Rhodophyta-Hildenbrandia_rubra.ctg13570.p1  ORF type:complete len:127 (-),score=3.79 Plantae.Rhodophyta-Hildenbrandia_rubra.ctg13570:1584-1964(-)